MSPASLIRLGGLAAVGAGVLLIISDLADLLIDYENMAEAATTFAFALSSWAFLLGLVLLLGGLVALYVYQSEEAGVLGLGGFVVAFLGTALGIGAAWVGTFIEPFIAVQAPQLLEVEESPGGFLVSFIILSVGWLLFAIATLRAAVFPRWAAILLVVGVVITFLPIPLSGIVFSAAVIWLGLVLFTGRGVAPGEQSRRVR